MSFRMRSFTGKSIVSMVRDGDYAHPGEEESIEILMSGIAPDKERKILDVGCGLGGTAEFMRKKGLGIVTAFDIDSTAIDYAKKRYPLVQFYQSDVMDITKSINEQFDIIYLFCSLYAFPDQEKALTILRSLAKQNTLLLIFEIIDLTQGTTPFIELNNKTGITHPVSLAKMPTMLKNANWELAGFEDLTNKHLEWYDIFLKKLAQKRPEIIKKYGDEAYQIALNRYTQWHDEIAEGRIGGGIFRAYAMDNQ